LSCLLFISDLHLSPRAPELVRRFHALLAEIPPEVDALYILGDLFDAWIGDDDPSPFAREIQDALKAFSNETRLFFQRGNRDFMVGGRFAGQTGTVILEDERLLECDGQRMLLMHGDQLCTDDLEYQQVRAMVRTPAFREQALKKSIAERITLANEYRRRSGAVENAMREHDATVLIHGHTHRPAMHEFELDGRKVRRRAWGSSGTAPTFHGGRGRFTDNRRLLHCPAWVAAPPRPSPGRNRRRSSGDAASTPGSPRTRQWCGCH